MSISLFTELLQDLTRISEKMDSVKLTSAESTELQRMQGRIIKGYQNKYYSRREYTALINIYEYLMDAHRELYIEGSARYTAEEDDDHTADQQNHATSEGL